MLIKKGDFAGAASRLQQGENVAPSDANIHDLYGQALEGAGKLDGAISEFRQSIALGPKQLQVMLRLAGALEKKGDWAGAVDEYHRAALTDASVDFRNKIIRRDDRDPQREYKDAQQRLADHLAALKAAGKSSEATNLEARIHTMEGAPGVSEQLDSSIRDGWSAARQRHFDEAREDFKRAVDLADKLQPHDARLMTALDDLGNTYLGQDWVAAQTAFERELKVAQELFGPQSPNLTGPLQSLGRNALLQHDYATASNFFFRAVDINEKVYGEGSDKVADSLVQATTVYFVQEDYPKAEPYLLRAVNIDQSLYGADSVGMLRPLSALCGLYDHWDKPDKSAACDQRLLVVLEKQYGENSPVLVTTLASEAKALRGMGLTSDADKVDHRLALIRAATMTPTKD